MLTTGVVESVVDGVPHRAMGRNEGRLVVEVETDLVGGFGICSQYIDAPTRRAPGAPPHKQTIIIYEHELRSVLEQVRTDAQIAAWETCKGMAKQSLGDKRAEIVRDIENAKSSSARERAEMALSEHEAAVHRLSLELLCKTPGLRSGLPPLLSAKVIKSNVPPPPSPQNIQANQMDNLASVLERLLDAREGKGRKT